MREPQRYQKTLQIKNQGENAPDLKDKSREKN